MAGFGKDRRKALPSRGTLRTARRGANGPADARRRLESTIRYQGQGRARGGGAAATRLLIGFDRAAWGAPMLSTRAA